jgi:hypothetical protein
MHDEDDLEWRVMDAEASRDMWRCVSGILLMLWVAAMLVIWRGAIP